MAELPRGRCPECGQQVALRKDGVTREHRARHGGPVCKGSGKMAIDPAAGEVAPAESLNRKRGESPAAHKARLEGAGHRIVARGGKLGPGERRHALDCPACAQAKVTEADVHPVTLEVLEPSLEQAALLAMRPGDAWLGAQAADLNPYDIDPDPLNPRTDLGDLGELASSLIANGMVQPVVVVPADPGRYQLVAGHRRVAAARLAGLPTIPALIRHDLTPAYGGDHAARRAAAQAVENLQRTDLNPLEQARAFRRLVDAGWKQERIAAAAGVNQGHVSKRLSLLKLGDDAQAAVATGTIAVEDAVELARLPKAAQPAAIALLTGPNPRNAIARAKGEYERDQAHQAVIDRLAADGVAVIDYPGPSWTGGELPLAVDGRMPPHVYARAFVPATPKEHKRCPGHVATIAPWPLPDGSPTVLYVCTDPTRHGIPSADEARDAKRADAEAERLEQEAVQAAEMEKWAARRNAAIAVAGGKIARPAMGEFLAAVTLAGMTGHVAFCPGEDVDDWLDAMTVLEDSALEAALLAGDDVRDDSDLLYRLGDACVERVGVLRFTFAAAVMAIESALTKKHRWLDRHHAGHPALVAWYKLLEDHGGYQLTDTDRALLEPPPDLDALVPMPADVPPEAIAWYGGYGPDDPARWIEEVDEAESVAALYPERVAAVPARAEPVVSGNQEGNATAPGEATADGASARCPGSGREFAGVSASSSAATCPACMGTVSSDARGRLVEHDRALEEVAG